MDDYRGYLNLTEAAGLIGVSTATLSRRREIGVALGGREVGLSPTEVLTLADFFKRRPLSEVAGGLVQHAYKAGPAIADAVTAEVDRILSAQQPRAASAPNTFLAEARRVLPKRLYSQVARYYQASLTAPASLGPADAMDEQLPRTRPVARRQTNPTIVSGQVSAEPGALARRA